MSHWEDVLLHPQDRSEPSSSFLRKTAVTALVMIAMCVVWVMVIVSGDFEGSKRFGMLSTALVGGGSNVLSVVGIRLRWLNALGAAWLMYGALLTNAAYYAWSASSFLEWFIACVPQLTLFGPLLLSEEGTHYLISAGANMMFAIVWVACSYPIPFVPLEPAPGLGLQCIVAMLNQIFLSGFGPWWLSRRKDSVLRAYRDAIRQAEQLAALRYRFVSSVSHELRTPLHGLSSFVNLLLANRLGVKNRELAHGIARCVDDLQKMIDDMLDFVTGESAEPVVALDVVDMSALAEDIEHRLDTTLAQRQVHLVVGFAKSRAVLKINLRFVRQVLINLIGCASEPMQKGKIVVGHQLVEKSADEGSDAAASARVGAGAVGGGGNGGGGEIPATLELRVSDPHGVLHRDFDSSWMPFTASSSSSDSGRRLALAIARSLVIRMGGTVSYSKASSRNSFFIVRLPTHVVMGPSGHSNSTLHFMESVSMSSSQRTAPHILVVDDNELNRRVMCRLLAKLAPDATVDVASGGLEALDLLRQPTFDLVLLDIMMPDLTGLEVASIFRRREKEQGWGKIPIVAVTAAVDPISRFKVSQEDLDGFISKPVNPKKLADTLRRFTNM